MKKNLLVGQFDLHYFLSWDNIRPKAGLMLKSDLMCLQQQQQHDGCNLSEHYHSVRKKQLVHDRVLALIQLLGSRSNLHRVMDHVEQIFRQFELTVRGNSEEIIPGVDHFPMQTKPQSNFLRHYRIRRWGNDCMEISGWGFFLPLLWRLLLPCQLGTQWDMKINPAQYLKRATQRHKHATSQWGRILTVATRAACHRWERKLENFQGNRGRTDSNWVDWTGSGVRPVVQAFAFDQSVISSTALA